MFNLPGKVEVVIPADYGLGESPHWDHSTNTLLYVDCASSTIYRWNPSTNEIKSIVLPDANVGCVVPRKSPNGLVAAAGQRFVAIDEMSGEITTLNKITPELAGTNFNDGKCDPAGRLWAGTMGEMKVLGEPIRNQGRLYCLDLMENCEEKLSTKLDISNGMSWTKDRTKMFHCDSLKYAIDVYDYDMSKGNISNQKTVITFEKEEGFPDGHCLDSEGNMWVAMHMGGCLVKIDPTTGKRLGKLVVSETASRITSVCFGGVNLDELFVTSARNLQATNEKDEGGSIFKITGTGSTGCKSHVYLG